MIQSALYLHLTTDPVVGALAGLRVYPLSIPQHVYNEATRLPCLVYQRVGGDQPIDTCGAPELAESLVRIDAYARSYEDADALAEAVRAALINHTGPMGSVHVSRVNLEGNALDLLDVEPGLYRVSRTFSIWHET
ncbi:MAG TPA: DUF3168 domain-containing protein [Thauera aminoaromatica]|nr:DUF3168 domain-containing protein [Thauera aminoaromatica]